MISCLGSHNSCSGKKVSTQLQWRKSLGQKKNLTTKWNKRLERRREKGKENCAYNILQNSHIGKDFRPVAYWEKTTCTAITQKHSSVKGKGRQISADQLRRNVTDLGKGLERGHCNCYYENSQSNDEEQYSNLWNEITR